jgi:hypothetical protein
MKRNIFYDTFSWYGRIKLKLYKAKLRLFYNLIITAESADGEYKYYTFRHKFFKRRHLTLKISNSRTQTSGDAKNVGEAGSMLEMSFKK